MKYTSFILNSIIKTKAGIALSLIILLSIGSAVLSLSVKASNTRAGGLSSIQKAFKGAIGNYFQSAISEVEPNETAEQATPISIPGQRSGEVKYGDAAVYEFVYNNGPRDKIEDLYKFTIPTNTTRRLDIVLTFANSSVDLDLVLFKLEVDGTRTQVAASNGNTTTERITPILTFGGGTYLIGVTAFDDENNQGATGYTLSVTPDTAPPPPVISSIVPVSAVAGGGPFSLTVNGSYFVSGQSVVRWNGASRTTTYVSDTQLVAFISAADIASAGSAVITVFNPPSLGGQSSPAYFTILPPGSAELEVEPNETTEQANLLLLAGKRAGTVALGDAAQLTIQLNNGLSDPVEDLFAVNLAQSSRLDVQLNGANSGSNLALYLMKDGPGAGQVTLLGNSRLSGPVQRITTAASLAAGRYLVGVSAVTGSSSYTVEAAIPGKRLLQVMGSSAAPNSTVTVPVIFNSEGDENTINFSLNFNTVVLSSPQVVAGKDAGGATISLNTSQTGLGRIGVRFSLPQGQKLTAGAREIVTVRFSINPAGGTNTTSVDFGDDPVVREMVDVQGNFLIGSYAAGGVVIAPGFEADVSPRPNGTGDGSVTTADWTQIGRFISGVDAPLDGGEFQRADCAPKSTLGDGRLTIADWVQAGRYAAGLETSTPAGGPSSPVTSSQAYFDKITAFNGTAEEDQLARTLKIKDVILQRGQDNELKLELVSQGNENAAGFSLNFDVSQLSFVSAVPGADATGAILNVNLLRLSEGRLGFGIALPSGQAFAAGTRELVKLTFKVLPSSTVNSTTLSFGDIPIAREVADTSAAVVAASFLPTVFQIQPEVNLIPGLNSLDPGTAFVGGASFKLTINGSNFIQGAFALVNGAPRVTEFVSGTQLKATIPAQDLVETGSLVITVQNSAPGGGVSNALSLAVVNPVPSVSSINPSSATTGARGFTLTVNGAGFVPGAVVQFNGVNRATIFVNSGQVNATILDSDLTDAGTFKVRVTNPSPGGGASNEVDFRVASISPIPRLQSISPETIQAGSAGFTLTVNGSGFVSSSIVRFNGNPLATTFVSNTQMTAQVPAELIVNPGTASITVLSPAPGGGSSNSILLAVSVPPNPVPAVTSISPTVVTAGGPQFTLIVNGINFVNQSVVRINDQNRSTTFISSTQLSALITAADITNGGAAGIKVFNPAPGGGLSNETTLTINFAPPAISQISPNSAVAGGPAFILNVVGTNFAQGSVVKWNGENRPTTFVSVSELTAQISAADIANVGTANITVFSPAPGGGTSNLITFAINQAARPLPRINSISPDNIMGGSGEFTLTVNGSNFVTDSVVRWNNSPRPTTFVSSTQLQAAISAADVAIPGTALVTVFTPQPGGGDSNALSFTINQPPNPVPAITSIDPTAVNAGSGSDFTLTVNGSGFVAGSIVQFEGDNRPTTFVNANQLKAQIAAAQIANAGIARIRVFSPLPGGGTSNELTLQILNPVPVITGLDPALVVEGGPDFTLKVIGTGFVSGAEVRVNGVARLTFRISSTQLNVTINAAEVAAAATLDIQVFNPAPGGGVSNTAKLEVKKRNPLPRLSSISPDVVNAGSNGFTLIVNGSNFVQGAVVRINGMDRQTDFVSDMVLAVQITPEDIASSGALAITVFNPEPGGGRSNAASLTVNNPVPGITGISPSSVVAGSTGVEMIVNGEGFVPNSVVQLNGVNVPTTFVTRTQISAQIPVAAIASGGTLPVTVFNPVPGGGTSNVVNLTITNPVALITSISPAQVNAGGPSFTLSINGSSFVNGSTVLINGQSLQTTFVNSGALTAVVPASFIANTGTADIRVQNPEPGGGSSNTVQLSIVNPVPTLNSLNPSTVTAGSPGFNLTVTGTGFVPASVVQWNGAARQTTFVSSAQLTIAVSASDVASAGTAAVVVINPAPGGGTSNTLNFSVNSQPNPVPVLSGLEPSFTVSGGTAFSLTVKGTSFTPGAVVQWNGQPRQTDFINSTTLAAQITAADIASAGSALITVINPAPGGGESNSLTFQINPPNPVPVISVLVPASAAAGSPAFTLTVNGTSFVNGSVAQWNGSPRPTSFAGSTQLTVSISAADVATIGTAEVRIFNPAPGGGLSNPVTFTISPQPNPVPVISSLSPVEANEGDPALTLTINGAGFIAGSTVQWNGAPRPTILVNGNQLTTQVSEADLFNPGNATVTVVNPAPGGGTSNTLNFTINALNVSCQTVCLRSSAYYAFNLNRLPNGRIIIGGVNFNTSVLVQSNTTSIHRALDGGSSPLQQLNRQYVAIQLSLLSANSLAASPGVLQSLLRCYEPNLATVQLSNGFRIGRNTKFGDLLDQSRLAIVDNREDDMLKLAAVLSIMNGNDPSGLCR